MIGGAAVRGAQVGVGALAAGPLEGVQVATVNLALDDVVGLQAGVVDVARGALHGMQVSSANLVGGPIRGAQVGSVNVALDDVTGAQVGGINVAAGRVSGAQVGVINYADDSDASIGLVSIVRHGRTDLEAWGTESGLVVAGVRHGGAIVHNVYGVGLQLGGENLWAMVVGLGVHFSLASWLNLDVDVLEQWLHKDFRFAENLQLATLQGAFGVPLGRTFEVLVAPTFNVLTGAVQGTGLAPPWATFDFHEGSQNFVHGWIGVSAGLRVNL